MSKFFVKNSQIYENKIKIINEDKNHIKNVLRYKIGDSILVCNENKENFSCSITEINENEIICNIENKQNINTELNVHITIFQGLPKSDKLEYIIQKCTEIGVSEFTPVNLKNCVVKINEKDEMKKLERWAKIADSAAKQSGRNIIPRINKIINIKELVEKIKEYDIIIVPYEKEEKTTLKQVLKTKAKENAKIGIVIGPEGGFDKSEIELLSKTNAKIITLGKRILRTETVGIVIAGIIGYELE